jgi:hypothetical protein
MDDIGADDFLRLLADHPFSDGDVDYKCMVLISML